MKKAVDDNYDLRWAWLDIPDPPSLHHAGLDKIVEAMDEDDPRWWPHVEVERHLLMMADAHRERVLSLKDREEVTYRTLYRRIRFGKQRAEVRKDDIAGCLRTARGGSSRQMVVRAGNGQIKMRHMTAREYARLQGVPDSYPILLMRFKL
ncbi:MAG: DNA cytosine methyltransferase [Anaerolineae bacterium]|nr:DNA cytosine methyltransferase [Anaerolineae bacterium]